MLRQCHKGTDSLSTPPHPLYLLWFCFPVHQMPPKTSVCFPICAGAGSWAARQWADSLMSGKERGKIYCCGWVGQGACIRCFRRRRYCPDFSTVMETSTGKEKSPSLLWTGNWGGGRSRKNPKGIQTLCLCNYTFFSCHASKISLDLRLIDIIF